MGKIYCTECGKELEDTVKFCSGCGTALADENNTSKSNNEIINTTKFNANDLISEIRIKPIVIGCILTYFFYFLGLNGLFGVPTHVAMYFPEGITYSILFGTFIAGLSYKGSVIPALIHGLIIAIIMIFFFLIFTITSNLTEGYLFCIIAGLFGSFIGNIIRTKINQTKQ